MYRFYSFFLCALALAAAEPADSIWSARYVITVDPGVYTVPSKTYNRALDEKHFPSFWAELRRSSLFKAEPALPEDPGIRIFRRTN